MKFTYGRSHSACGLNLNETNELNEAVGTVRSFVHSLRVLRTDFTRSHRFSFVAITRFCCHFNLVHFKQTVSPRFTELQSLNAELKIVMRFT